MKLDDGLTSPSGQYAMDLLAVSRHASDQADTSRHGRSKAISDLLIRWFRANYDDGDEEEVIFISIFTRP